MRNIVEQGCKKYLYNVTLSELFLLENFSPLGSPELAAKIFRAEKKLAEHRRGFDAPRSART